MVVSPGVDESARKELLTSLTKKLASRTSRAFRANFMVKPLVQIRGYATSSAAALSRIVNRSPVVAREWASGWTELAMQKANYRLSSYPQWDIKESVGLVPQGQAPTTLVERPYSVSKLEYGSRELPPTQRVIRLRSPPLMWSAMPVGYYTGVPRFMSYVYTAYNLRARLGEAVQRRTVTAML